MITFRLLLPGEADDAAPVPFGVADVWARGYERRIQIREPIEGRTELDIQRRVGSIRLRDHALRFVSHWGGLDDEAAQAHLLSLLGAGSVRVPPRAAEPRAPQSPSAEDSLTEISLDDDGLPRLVASQAGVVEWTDVQLFEAPSGPPRAMSAKGAPWERTESLGREQASALLGAELPETVGEALFLIAELYATRRAVLADLHVWWRNWSTMEEVELVAGSTSADETYDADDPTVSRFDRAGHFLDFYGPNPMRDRIAGHLEIDKMLDAIALPELSINGGWPQRSLGQHA